MEIAKLKGLAQEFSFNAKPLLKEIPLTMGTVVKRLGLDPKFVVKSCCPDCFSLYPLQKHEQLETTEEITMECSARFYSKSKKYVKGKGKDAKIVCGKPLTRPDSLVPLKTFTYQPLKDWLASKMWEVEFEDLLDQSLKAKSRGRKLPMDKIWHGSVWKNLEGPGGEGDLYTANSGNLVFIPYVDWVNPCGNHIGKCLISLGAILMVCFNLPVEKRNHPENIFLF